MARIYAGILGPLAFVTVLVRSVLHSGGVESSLMVAWCALVAFFAIGYIVGYLAELTVEQAVTAVISSELDAMRSEEE